MQRSRLAALALLAAAGCAAAPGPGGAAPLPLHVRLVDSVPWSHELGEGVLRRVEVRDGRGAHTIPGVLVYEVPIRVGRRLLGFSYLDDEVQGVYAYDLGTREVSVHRPPPDLNPLFSEPALAPDGRHLAYVAAPGDGTGWAVVRSWPAGDLVWRSEAVEVPATDSPGGNGALWRTADRAEVFVEMGPATDTAWLRVLGSVRARRVLAADTLREPPPR